MPLLDDQGLKTFLFANRGDDVDWLGLELVFVAEDRLVFLHKGFRLKVYSCKEGLVNKDHFYSLNCRAILLLSLDESL